MDICHFLFYYYCVFLFFSSTLLNDVCGAESEAAAANHHHVIDVKSLLPASTCSSSASGRKPPLLGIQLTHRYGPCSPLNQDNSSPTSHQLLLEDQSRVNSINARMSNMYHPMGENGENTRLPIPSGAIGGGNYVVTVGFGTPKQDFTLIFDTGSSITWIQCQQCSGLNSCYDPSKSSSYSPAQCSNSTCSYSIIYADKSYSEGHYIRDTLTITPSDIFSNFIFGCGQNNSGNFGSAAGLLGIGHDGDAVSLLSQTYSDYALIFCYCLPAKESSTGYLLFGLEALRVCSSQRVAPLVNDPNRPSFYFVNLIGITIGGKKLSLSSLRTVIDSGTIITRLPSSLYSSLRSAFKQLMSQYPSAPPSLPLLDTCYNLEGYKNVTIPAMELEFEKAKVSLDPSAVIRKVSDSQFCLAFAGNNDASELTIIGNHQQRTLNILYDVQEKKVEFSNSGC